MSSHDHTPTTNEQHFLQEIDRVQSLIASLPDDAEQQARLATIGLLVSFFAHECRNRLTPIIGYARTASRSPEDRDLVQTALLRIGESAYDLAQLSDLILGQSSRQRAACSVAAAWETTCERLADDLTQPGVHLQAEIDPNIYASISSYALAHVYENVLRNAIEAGDQSIRISVRACSTRNTGDIHIEIEDNAGGMTPEMAHNVGRTMVSGKSSTGLGLALCRFLVESAGGTFSIESRHGTGTTVSISIPEADSNSVQSATTPAEEVTHPRG
jgi:signal transduction histidine kinase